MARVRSYSARDFRKAALQRFEDAEILLERDRLTGAFYLAGYGAECILKALILSTIDDRKLGTEVERSFKGPAGHNIEELRSYYKKKCKRTIPALVSDQLTRILTWRTDLRYESSVKSRKEAEAFLDAVRDVIRWADGCISHVTHKKKS